MYREAIYLDLKGVSEYISQLCVQRIRYDTVTSSVFLGKSW